MRRCLLALSLLACSGPVEPAPDAGSIQLGTATPDGPCAPGPIANTTCEHLVVSCEGNADLGVGVRVTRPATAIGTVVLGTGGGGMGFLEDHSARELAFVEELVTAGYVVVRRSWDDVGWFAGTAGVTASACRYATLLAWIDANVRESGAPYCALGISGGAIEIAYALSRWDAADRLSGAVLLAGPSISQLDVVCPSTASEPWLSTDCPALAARYGVACGGLLYCTLQGADEVVDSAWMPDMPCSTAGDRALLEADGSVRAGERLRFPNTRVRMVEGADECGATPLLFLDAIDTDHALTLVPGTPHDVFSTDAGTAAARTALRDACGF